MACKLAGMTMDTLSDNTSNMMIQVALVVLMGRLEKQERQMNQEVERVW